MSARKSSQSLSNAAAEGGGAGASASRALEVYNQEVGNTIMRPNGDRAYLPVQLWAAPLWLPDNRRAGRRRYPVKWTSKSGDVFETDATDELTVRPDMGVLLGLVALWQLKLKDCKIVSVTMAARDDVRPEQLVEYLRFRIPISEVYAVTGYNWKSKHRLLQSLKRLATITVNIKYREGA